MRSWCYPENAQGNRQFSGGRLSDAEKRAKISRSFFFEGKKKKNVYFYQLQGEMIYRVKHLEMLFIFHHYCQTSVVLKAL